MLEVAVFAVVVEGVLAAMVVETFSSDVSAAGRAELLDSIVDVVPFTRGRKCEPFI